MSNENENPDFNTKPEPKKLFKNYNKMGVLVSNKDEYVMAKEIITQDGESQSSKYRLATYQGVLYSPGGIHSNRERGVARFFKYKDVSKENFDMYVEFLKTRNLALYNAVSRKMLNND
jgi:hypothetical protein